MCSLTSPKVFFWVIEQAPQPARLVRVVQPPPKSFSRSGRTMPLARKGGLTTPIYIYARVGHMWYLSLTKVANLQKKKN
jgi:hypothetical protein